MAEGEPRKAGLLTEIEGLRAVAVGTVLLFHAHLGFSGGYVGVDVFFVVSGFLITGLILREYEETGRVSLREFYARRARRLLPAAALVLLVTLVLADRLFDPLRAARNAVDALYAAGFVANFRFAASGADYFEQGMAPSAIQHWWSLAVEEQFYFLWPGLLALTWRVFSRSRRPVRVRMSALAVVLVIGVVSFIVGYRLTSSNPSWGYFATWSRGWELAAGAACAFLWAYRDRVHALVLRSILGWVGMVLIGYSALRFDGSTPFPGTAAWYPVAGTILVIASIGTKWGPGLLLSLRPMQWIGGRSYGIYLWHWPLLIALEERVDDPSAWARAAMLVLSVVLAALSYRFVENPIRHQRALVVSPWRSLATGVVLTGLVIGGGVVGRTLADDIDETGYTAPTVPTTAAFAASTTVAPTSSIAAPDSTRPADSGTGGTVTPTTSAAPTTTLAPLEELRLRVANELQPLIAASLENDLLPDNLRPPITKLPRDKSIITRNGCLLNYSTVRNPPCVFGDPESDTHILMYGDSHTAHWFPAVDAIAQRRSWKVTVRTKAGCPSADVRVVRFDKPRYEECDRWQERTLQQVVESDADLVVTSNYRYRGYGVRLTNDVWQAGLERMVEALVGAGKQVLLLSDIPVPGKNQAECLADNPRRIQRCSHEREISVRKEFILIDQAVAEKFGVSAYDPTEWFCAQACPAVIGDMAVRFDEDHISQTYAAFLAAYLEPVLLDALARGTTGP